VDILHEHNNTYHKSQNGWSSETWKLMVRLFHDRQTHVKFTKAHIQDKEKDLKRDYRMLKEARMQSGIGWNDNEFKLQAEPRLWEIFEIVSFPTLVVILSSSSSHLFNSCSYYLFNSCSHLFLGLGDSETNLFLFMIHLDNYMKVATMPHAT
jgi:hypothetical protein